MFVPKLLQGIGCINWETLSLFGDGAAAVIIKYDETNESGAIHYDMQTYSEGVEYTIIKGGGNKYFLKTIRIAQRCIHLQWKVLNF